MIFKILAVIFVILIVFISYIFYSNNKGKHKNTFSNKKLDSYYKEDREDSFSILNKDSLEDNSIKELLIDKDIILIEDKSFINCTNLSSIKVDEGNKNYCSKLGVLFSKDMKTVICYPPLKLTSTYFIPQGVKKISIHTFFNNNHIKYVIIPTSLEYIDENTFVNCKFLNQIVIPESVKQIHPRAFNLCPRLIIRCYENSVAEDYCKRYFIPYQYLSN